MTTEAGRPPSLIEAQVERFLEDLRNSGYAERTVHKKRSVARAFARWAKRKRIATDDLNDTHVRAFVTRSRRKRKARVRFELAAMRLFFDYLRPAAALQCHAGPEPASAAARLLLRYEDYLRRERGLAENSLRVYIPLIRDFLAAQTTPAGIAQDAFDTLTIRSFLLTQTQNRSDGYVRLLGTALRSLFRFLFLHGETSRDLSTSVPMVRRYRQAVPPVFLSPEEVESVLTATDRSVPSGRRDYAILLLLARLGLRAGEIVSLELNDIHWRAGEIIVHGKGRMLDQLPLLADVGEALVAYIREDRGVTSSRRIFLRMRAPLIGLGGPAAVCPIVRQALARAGVRRSGRGASHLFRHGLATNMIRHGASLAEISEVLRHRSQTTTAIYTQVSFEALRAVAQPWPLAGGAQ
jgi:integrase/recombinase XerD